MVAIKGRAIGPVDASGSTTPFAGNALDSVRHETYLNARGGGIGGKGGIHEGFVPSIVAGQLQLSFTAGSAFAPERDASSVPLARGYDVWNDAASVVQFGAAHATLGRIDTVVAAAVDGEDGAVGTGALAIGFHLVAVPGTAAASPAAPLDSAITTFLGRGGWTRLYDVLVPAAATQLILANASFRGNRLNGWNNISELPFTLTNASGWSIQFARYKYDHLTKLVSLNLQATRTGANLDVLADGNLSPDVQVTSNWPTALLPADDEPMFWTRNGVVSGHGRVKPSNTSLEVTHVFMTNDDIQTNHILRFFGDYYLDRAWA